MSVVITVSSGGDILATEPARPQQALHILDTLERGYGKGTLRDKDGTLVTVNEHVDAGQYTYTVTGEVQRPLQHAWKSWSGSKLVRSIPLVVSFRACCMHE